MTARPRAKIVGFVLAVFAVLGVGTVGLISAASGPDSNHTAAATPVVLADLSTVTAADYHYAADHLTDFAQIPCYCGCDRDLRRMFGARIT